MGLIISVFRKEKSPSELLEEIEYDIKLIEEDRQSMMMRQKKYVGKLIIYSIVVYIVFAVVLYLSVFYGYKSLRDGLLYTLPLVIIPIICFLARKGLNFFFSNAIVKNKQKLMDLRAKKKKILDDVMEKETFKVAKNILEKYAPDQLVKTNTGSNGTGNLMTTKTKLSPSKQASPTKEKTQPTDPVSSTPAVASGDSPPRAPIQPQQMQPSLHPPSPQGPVRRASASQIPSSTAPAPPPQLLTSQLLQPSTTLKRGLVRPLPPPQFASRGIMEKLIEYLIGDGPSRRYALICSHCSVHNGMALQEEFEYVSFRCAYCGFPNPSRKNKPRKTFDPHNLLSEINSGDSSDQETREGDESRTSEDGSTCNIQEVHSSEVAVDKAPEPVVGPEDSSSSQKRSEELKTN